MSSSSAQSKRPSMRRTRSVPEAARILHISEYEVRRRIHAGELPAYKVGNKYRIPNRIFWRWQLKNHFIGSLNALGIIGGFLGLIQYLGVGPFTWTQTTSALVTVGGFLISFFAWAFGFESTDADDGEAQEQHKSTFGRVGSALAQNATMVIAVAILAVLFTSMGFSAFDDPSATVTEATHVASPTVTITPTINASPTVTNTPSPTQMATITIQGTSVPPPPTPTCEDVEFAAPWCTGTS